MCELCAWLSVWYDDMAFIYFIIYIADDTFSWMYWAWKRRLTNGNEKRAPTKKNHSLIHYKSLKATIFLAVCVCVYISMIYVCLVHARYVKRALLPFVYTPLVYKIVLVFVILVAKRRGLTAMRPKNVLHSSLRLLFFPLLLHRVLLALSLFNLGFDSVFFHYTGFFYIFGFCSLASLASTVPFRAE